MSDLKENNVLISDVNLKNEQMNKLLERCELIKEYYLGVKRFNKLNQLYSLNIETEIEEYYLEFMINEGIVGKIVELINNNKNLDIFIKSTLEYYYPTDTDDRFKVKAYKSENDIYRIEIKEDYDGDMYLLLWGYSKSKYESYDEAIKQYIRLINSQFNYIEGYDVEEYEYGMPVGVSYKNIVKDEKIDTVKVEKIITEYTIEMEKAIYEMNELNNEGIEEFLNMDTEEINAMADKFEFEFFTCNE